ncbi:MAG: N-acetylneuraminate synthase family protein, partial [Gemmatimonadota bacterium]|nr:N-acetylneuraminate synthase family protein [Gemmatimonadota bacterium]
LGAAIVEKHFTTDRELPGPDHKAALEPDELAAMVAAIRAVEQGLGDGVKRPAPSEEANLKLVRRSLHTARPLAAGHTVADDDLVALRPATGMPPSAWPSVVGRKVRDAVPAGVMLNEKHFA